MNTDPAVPGMSANAASHHKCQPVQQIAGSDQTTS